MGSKAYINGITSDKVIVDMLYYSGIEKQTTKRGSFWAIYRHLPLISTVSLKEHQITGAIQVF